MTTPHTPGNENNSFTLAQISDPHLSSLVGVRIGDLLNKRVLGYLSWRLHRRAEHRGEVLSALVQDLRAVRPDHIVVTGDLTHVGLPSEFRQVREWLDSLGTPSDVTVIPGNHDAYVTTAWNRTFALWTPYMVSDPRGADTESSVNTQAIFPSLRVRGRAALIGLSTARPSAPFLAVGSLGSDQLRKLAQILEDTGRQDLCRILLLHHPPFAGAVAWRKRLTDGASLRAVLARHGAELILHGHAHRTSLVQLDTSSGSLPAIGVPSASARGRKPGRRAQYHLYRVTRTVQGWDLQVSVRGYSSADDCFIAEGESRLTVHRPVTPTA